MFIKYYFNKINSKYQQTLNIFIILYMNKPVDYLSRDQIKAIIAQKAWYGFNPETGEFSWERSLKKLGEELRLMDIERLGKIFRDAFTPKALTKIKRLTGGEQGSCEEISLLQVLQEEGFFPYVWTVGDKDWQRTKFERVGANRYIPDDRYCFFSENKEFVLPSILEKFQDQNPERILLIIVDDKSDNLRKAKEVLKREGVKILDYHFKINDPQANADAFYHWLLKQREKKSDKRIELILDFDGVIADIDSVFFNDVVEGIFQDLNQKKS